MPVGALDPDEWNGGRMVKWILDDKTGTLQGQDTTGPIAVAVSSFVGGVEGTAAIGNRAFCQGECRGPLAGPATAPAPFVWTWLPGHNP